MVREIIAEEGLNIDVRLVPSSANLADKLTRVPKSWRWAPAQRGVLIGNAAATVNAFVTDRKDVKPTLHDIRAIHDRSHFGVDRTLDLARERFNDVVSRKTVKRVVSRCDRCARIDPAITFDGTTVTWQPHVYGNVGHLTSRMLLAVRF
jgi:hypothetical protein